jgi:putative transposase
MRMYGNVCVNSPRCAVGGYRRPHILLAREGMMMNHKKPRRLYREERLQVRHRGGREHASADRRAAGAQSAQEPGLHLGRVLRWPALSHSVVLDVTWECAALVADTSLPGLRVVRELDSLAARRGRTAKCASDNGTELTSKAVLRWSQETQVKADYNQERPHSGIGNLPPALYTKLSAMGTQRAGALRYTEGLRAPSRCVTEPSSELN